MATNEATLIKQAQAAQWALNQIGRQDYLNLCQRFIENAYGTSGNYRSAAVAGNALNMNIDPAEADVGDLVFFRPDPSNGMAGHVGINIGNGQMVSSTNKGVTVDNFLQNGYWKNLLVGIGDPPPQWQGRPDAKELVAGATTLVAKGKATAGNPVAAAWGAAAPYAQELMRASVAHGVPVNVLAGLLIQESGGDPRAVSRAGAQGLMQFMPGTARGMGIDPFDPAQAIDAGARYLGQLAEQSGGDWAQAVGKYNAGPAGNLNNAETRNHITKVMGFAEGIGGSIMQTPPPGGPFGGPPNLPGGPGGPGGPPGGGDRNRDRNRPNPMAALLSRLQELGVDIGTAAGEIGRDLPQMPQLQGPNLGNQSTSPYRGPTNQAGNQTVQVNVADLQEAFQRGGPAGLQDFMIGLMRAASPVGAAIAATGTNDVAPGMTGGYRNPPAYSGPTNPGGRTPPTMPSTGGPPGGPGGGGRRDTDFIMGIAGQEARDQAGPGQSTGPSPARAAADPNKRPAGWTDPSLYSGTDRAQVEQANALLAQIDAAQAKLAIDPQDPDAQNALNTAIATFQRMGPTLANIEERRTAQADKESGTILPGTSPSSKYITVYRKNPQTGQMEIQQIPNPNPEESGAEIAANASRYSSDVAAGSSRYASDASRANAQTAADASRYGADVGAATSLGVAGINSQTQLTTTAMTTLTQRVTTALAAAVDQQRNLLTAQIESGKLTFDQGKERWAQWYKTNVEAPLAILQQQRETEQYKLNTQNAITQRAGQQAEHERGVGTLSNAAYGTAANAYSTILNQTAPAGWNQSFQGQLGDALQGKYTPNPNSTLQVSESMDDFARRHVAEMLKGISPYAASIAGAQGQIGDPGQVMSGGQMTGLQQQATGVVSDALANPQQMPETNTNFMPQPIDIGQFAMAGTNGSLPALPPPQPDFSSRPGAGQGRG